MTAKTDALVALREVARLLTRHEGTVSGLTLTQLVATVTWAFTCVEQIEETKRPRRAPHTDAPGAGTRGAGTTKGDAQ